MTSKENNWTDDYINANYGTGTYSDWYLPGSGELNDLWNNIKAVNKALDSDGDETTTAVAKTSYWSSSEWHDTPGVQFYFQAGWANPGSKSSSYYVRAVRAL